jgi:hypothetical protein
MRARRRDLQQSGEDFLALLNELQTYLGPEWPGPAVIALNCSPKQIRSAVAVDLASAAYSLRVRLLPYRHPTRRLLRSERKPHEKRATG